jgi:23S rRNA-/tRNA-specific pseudouridylate synthase
LLICPLNRETHLDLKTIFKKREIQKKYRAIVEGEFKTKSGTIELPLASSNVNRKKRTVNAQGREAITEFKVLSSNDKYSWIELNLITGRNHQIRAHLEYLKTPIVNDILYGANHHENLEKNMICLQAFKLKFLLSNENFEFTIDQPDYFSSIL